MTRSALAAAAALLAVPGVAVAAGARAGFDNTEPLAAMQWYLPADHAWDYWAAQPKLAPIRVAVIDSGIDGGHPDLKGRVVAARSFVGGSPYTDEVGHGTFVAGLIAANPANAEGIAGLAFNARLVVGKVVYPDGSVSVPAEVAAIHWAVDMGARVINLSLGGVRDPLSSRIDTYSPSEQAAVEYAYSKGAVIVAAVGNGSQSPKEPWPYAHYPAALPHVLGVGAVAADNSVPTFSNRDSVYLDLAAPGVNIFSTVPRQLVADPACVDGPYSDCGPDEFHDAIGTSFAAPQVAAAAALLLGRDPALRPDEVMWLLERYATDDTPASGCAECATGRDALTGWGTLDVAASLSALGEGALLPPRDALEPNDDAGSWAHDVPPLPRTVDATLDYWDDDVDVYRVHLQKGDHLYARLTPRSDARVAVALWSPGTAHVEGLRVDMSRRVAEATTTIAAQERLGAVARRAGTYYIEAKLLTPTHDPVSYALSMVRQGAVPASTARMAH